MRVERRENTKNDSRKAIIESNVEYNSTEPGTGLNSFLHQSNFFQTQSDVIANCQESHVPLLATNCREIQYKKNICNDALDSADIDRSSFVNNKLLDLEKDIPVEKGNLTRGHFKDSQTQTKNVKYKRNIFGEPFDQTYIFDEANTILQLEDSDAQLTLPESITKDGSTEVFASTFRDIKAMTDKLDLPDNQFIASPAVEYSFATDQKLDGFARVRLPFVGKADNLAVLKFESDEGLNAHARTIDVPKKDKENEDLDLFYVVEGNYPETIMLLNASRYVI